jgi:hypothetical protein
MARQADQMADYLRRADADVLRQDVERLARRQPALVLGGAFVAGLIGARFLKSSERRRQEEGFEYDSDAVYRTPGSTFPAGYTPASGSGTSGYGSEVSGYGTQGAGYGSGTSGSGSTGLGNPGTLPPGSSGYTQGGLGGSTGGPVGGS